MAQHVDVNIRADDGSTALLWAAHWNDLETTDLLLHAGADANAANDFRMTPLSQACVNGSAAFVESLLKAGANPNTAIGTGETPLMTCAKSGNADAVRTLIAHDAAINAKEPMQNQTALMWAAAEHHPAVVKMLIDAHADLQAHTKKGFTALHFAAREGDQESARLLLAAGLNVNIHTQPDAAKTERIAGGDGGNEWSGIRRGSNKGPNAGYTPLLVATVRGQVPLALFLLEQGADPNVGDAGYTPLHWAVTTWESGTANPVYGIEDAMAGIPDRQAKLQLVKALLAHGADPNARMTSAQPSFAGGYTDAVGATPILLASAVDDVEMMRILLAAGADPKMVTATNATTIMAATGLHHLVGESPVTEAQALAAVKFLLDAGVTPKGATTFGENALFGPAYRGWNTLLAQLIDLGVDVNVVSKAGVTPWLAASGQGDRLGGVLYNKEGADLLLKHGADPKLGHPCQAQNKCRELSSRETMMHAARRAKIQTLLTAVFSSLGRARSVSRLPRTRPRLPRAQLVTQYCVSCHNQKLKTANIMLDDADAEHVANSAETWEKVIVKLRSRSMPPPGIRRPDNATYDAVAGWLESELDRAAAVHVNPGRSAGLHRLNRTEYANAVRDLIAVDVDAPAMLPPDEQAFGFDTNADALSMQPALLDRYVSAAAKVARLALGDPSIPAGFERYSAVKGNSNEQTYLWQTERLDEDFPLGSRGGIAARHYFPVDGEYVFKVRLQRTYGGVIRGLNAANQIEIRVDGTRVGQFTVGGGPAGAAAKAESRRDSEEESAAGRG